MFHRFGLSLTLTPLLVALPAGAQQPAQPSASAQSAQSGPELIPRELALALITYGPVGGGGDLRVGRAPDGLPPELIPAGAQVLGSISQFDNSIVVLTLPVPPDSASDLAAASMLAAGWTRPPTSPMIQRGGFVDAQAMVGPSMSSGTLCKGEAFVNLAASYRRSGGSILKVMHTAGARYSPCRPPESRMGMMSEIPVPTLYSPEGALTNGGGGVSRSGDDHAEMSTRLSSRMKPSEITRHYATQLLKDGWTPVAEGDTEFFAGQMFRKADDKGRVWHATLITVARPDRSDRDVSLRLSRR
jgi:hypothetical protein